MENHTELTDLYLANNSFHGTLPSFAACANLSALHIADNFLTGFAANKLYSTLMRWVFVGTLPSFSLNRMLRRIIVNNNQLTGVIPSFILNTQFVELALGSNDFIGM